MAFNGGQNGLRHKVILRLIETVGGQTKWSYLTPVGIGHHTLRRVDKVEHDGQAWIGIATLNIVAQHIHLCR